jgi:hypothetical protein
MFAVSLVLIYAALVSAVCNLFKMNCDFKESEDE